MRSFRRISSRGSNGRGRFRRELTLDLATELGHLAPFGLGNPGVILLLPSCDLSDVAQTADGKHLRFRVRHRDRPAGSAIAFGLGRQADRARREVRHDVLFRLRRTAGTAPSRRSSSSVRSSRHRAPREPAEWLAEFRKTPGVRDATAQAIFDELGLEAGARGGSCSSRTDSGHSWPRSRLLLRGGEGLESRSVLRCSRRARESRLASNQASARIVRL
jgi:hypothetical protein